MTINASKGDGATTRALNLTDHTLNATWATSEHVYVQKGSDWATGSLVPDANAATANLSGELSDITIVAGDELTLQFPKSGDITYTGQVGTLADIAANFDYATATVEVASVSATGNIIPKAATTSFENQQAIVKFTLIDKADGTTPLSATELVVNDGTNTYTVTPASAASEIYVAIPGFSGQAVTLSATVGSDVYIYEKTGVTFINGKYYEITVKMTKWGRDLSMVDCTGNVRPSRWTANCYMVQSKGNYRLPLVYGNAIKAGTDNTTAYNPGGTTSDTYCANFVNHAGNAINAPWITKSTSGTGVNKGMGIAVASAELLWQDAKGLVTAVDISGDYLTLTVGKDASTQEGNALIAAKDASGTIVWSWHIWVTKQTFAASALTTVNTGSHTYTVTPVNLGWVGAATSATGYNTYYQWGRKDAFIPSKGTPSTGPTYTTPNHTVYDIDDQEVTGFTNSTTQVAIADNIKNPTTFYHHENSYPSSDTYYNMWDAQQTGTDNITTATKKTVYDPCPAGFCVPTGNLYYYIVNGGESVSSEWDSTNKGRKLTSVTPNNVFFPASGFRSSQFGTIYSVGTYSYCWSASAYVDSNNDNNARCLGFNQSGFFWLDNHRASGYPVRAVAEE